MYRSIVVIFIFIFFGKIAFSQVPFNYGPPGTPNPNPIGVVDGVFVKSDVPQKKVISYEHVREADYVWAKRVFSYIDLREKFNYPLFYPHEIEELDTTNEWATVMNSQRYSLWSIIKMHVKAGTFIPFRVKFEGINDFNGDLTASLSDGYDFKYPIIPKVASPYAYQNDKSYRDALDADLLGVQTWELGNKLTSVLDPSEDSVKIVGGIEVVQFDTNWTRKRYTSKDIVRYHLKTDWFFDKERGVLDHRVIGIAPVIYGKCETAMPSAGSSNTSAPSAPQLSIQDEIKLSKEAYDKAKTGKDSAVIYEAEVNWLSKELDLLREEITNFTKQAKDSLEVSRKLSIAEKSKERIASQSGSTSTGGGGGGVSENNCYKELFWLYFPQMRPILQNYYTYNDKNDAQWMSFDDLFWKTKYTQVIYKESNVYDRKIESYARGVDALIESERIKEEIRTFEHDVWNF
jgi:hypothetical protein